jgi:basic amino acid/polyamine antiporter, APA family
MLLVLVVGNIIGTGVHTLFGSMVARAGGAVWATFVLALFTAYSYAELVTKYPDAAGAPLYASKAFKRPFWAFMVTFGVASSGITSASTAARQFGNLSPVVPTQEAFNGGTLAALNGGRGFSVVAGALLFIVVLGLVNFRGIKESTKVNIALTVIEVGGLLLVVGLGMVAVLRGAFDPARLLDLPQGSSVPLALLGGTALAFFALVGFEDTVNLAEIRRIRQRPSLAPALGLVLTCIVYLAVSVLAVVVVKTDQLARADTAPLLAVAQAGDVHIPPRLFSVIALIAVTDTALINLIMASRLLYGMASQRMVPAAFGRVHRMRRTPVVAIDSCPCSRSGSSFLAKPMN